ncbi:Transcriptional activator protein DAL81 [Talaromyces pinophilus]|nr:Transcriptional activator protein DAL81 [Talaromyces pinophilus]
MRACDVCRKKKQRCVTLHGSSSCLTCQAAGLSSCTFLQPPPPKRRATAANTKEFTSMKPRGRGPSEELSSVSPNSTLDQELDYPKESILTKTLGLEKSRFSELIGPGGEHDSYLLRTAYARSGSGLPGNGDSATTFSGMLGSTMMRKVHENVFFQFTPDAEVSQSFRKDDSWDEVSVDDVESLVRPHGATLIKLYFRIVHPSFPILHKNVFIEKYNRTYREITAHLLAAVYALAVCWWSYDPDLLLQEKINEAALVRIAHRAVQDAIHRPRLNTIQAGLLLLQRHRNPLFMDNSWMWSFTSSLLGLGQHLGLHLDCSSWDIPEWEKGLRKRLAWALYIQDSFSALVLGRPCLISEATDWIVKPLESTDFSEGACDEEASDQIGSVSIENGKVLFMELVSLSLITARMLRELYSVRSLAEVLEPQQVLAVAKPLGTDLAQMLKNLPEVLSLENIEPGKLCVNGFLHLALHATTAALHRRLLWAIQQSKSELDPQFVQFIRKMLRTRAHSLVQFMSHLRPEHMEAFWFFAAGGCSTILGGFLGLLRTTSITLEESEDLRNLMKEFEWQLRMKAKMSDWVSYTLTRLRALGWDEWKNSKIALPEPSPNTFSGNVKGNAEIFDGLSVEIEENGAISPFSNQPLSAAFIDLDNIMSWTIPDSNFSGYDFIPSEPT